MQNNTENFSDLPLVEKDVTNTPWDKKPYIVLVLYEHEHGGGENVVATNVSIGEALSAAQRHVIVARDNGYYQILNLKTNKFIGFPGVELSSKEKFMALYEKYKDF